MARDTLLVIDESPLDLTVMRAIFKQLFHVECFEEARPALARIHRDPKSVCVVLLDICLGRRGAGFQVLQQLQANQETAELPVILVTSDAKEENVLTAVAKGATDFLVKPVDPLTLQERVCAAVRRTWPSGTTILDDADGRPEADSDTPDPAGLPLTEDYWDRLLELFFQARPGLASDKYHVLSRITEAFANGLRKTDPGCGLTEEDARLIGRAATYCDVGLLGIPDSVIEQGQDQGGAGLGIYFRHITLGHALFTTGPSSGQPLARYAAEITYLHHKNYDGTGYPTEALPGPLPLSAQLVRTATRCMGYMNYFHGYPDRLDRTLRALASDVGRFISSDMYQAAQAARDELAACLPEQRLL